MPAQYAAKMKSQTRSLQPRGAGVGDRERETKGSEARSKNDMPESAWLCAAMGLAVQRAPRSSC